MLEGGSPNTRHHGKGTQTAMFCLGVELSLTVLLLLELSPKHTSLYHHSNALLQKVNSWPMHIPERSFRTVLPSHKLSSN